MSKNDITTDIGFSRNGSSFDFDTIKNIIDRVTQSYALKCDIEGRIDDLSGTLRVNFHDELRKMHLSHLFYIEDIFLRSPFPYDEFRHELECVLEDFELERTAKKYRDILVDQIKSAGQQLIDRAEEMVSDKASYIKGCSINIDIPQPSDEPVSISWTLETFDTSNLKQE